MLTEKKAEEALTDIRDWGNRIAKRMDEAVDVDPYYDGESRTYVLRLVKGSRILLFRLSEAQVHDPAREAECERTLQRKIKDLWNLL